ARAQRESIGRLTGRLSTNRKFHRKIYLMRETATLKAVVGSSNLTKEGLTSGGEFALAVALQANATAARKLCASFEQQWELGMRLEERQIRLYEKRYRLVHAAEPP